jgi:shikimate kinase
MLNGNKLYIIGFMGSGKTHTGSRLAGLLGWNFTDLDKSIEEHAGKTIPEIFAVNGETWFRNLETEVLRSLRSASDTVISTGGGTPCFGDNMDFMLETGLTLYLKLTPGQLKSRLSNTRGERPLIKDLNDEGLLSYIEEKLEFRERWYSRAELTLDGFNTDVRFIYSKVSAMLIT